MKTTFPKSSFIKILILSLFLLTHGLHAQFGIDTSKITAPGWQPQTKKQVLTAELLPSPVLIGLNNLRFSAVSNPTAIDVSTISAQTYIQNRYNRQFNRRNPFALPPGIFGNTKVCHPTPGTTTLTGTGTPAAVNPWVSSNPAVATINSAGVVTSIATGATTITYTDNIGNNASVNVNVYPLPTITGTLVKCVGGTTQLTGSGTPDATSPWTSSSPLVASVSNTGLVTGLMGGSTTITYTNNNGCQETAIVTINPLLAPTITCGTANTTSVGFNWSAVTGAATYTVSYKVNGGATIFIGNIGNVLTYTITGVNPTDVVTIIVTPSGAVGTCFASGTANCAAAACTPAMLPAAPTVAVTQPTCTVGTGDITITAVAGLTYKLDSGAYSMTLTYSGLTPGPHTVTARNALGCTATTNITINPQPPTPAAPTLTPTQPTCTVATGSVTITGVAGETYSFDTAPYSGTLIYAGLAAGSSHTVTARNSDGCISGISNITLNAQPPIPSAPVVTVTQPTCTTATGTITITAVAGETYSFDGSPYGATLVFPGLAAGSTHNVIARNGSGCSSAVTTITLNAQPATPAAPTLTATHPTCTVATGTVTITGLAGYTYSFDSGPYNGTLIYSGLAAGSSHTVTAQNAAGCISAISNITLNAQPATPAAPTLTPTQPTCTVATGTITITGVAGLTYSFDSGPYNGTLVYSGLVAGSSHTVTAQNAAGCISSIANITLNAQPPSPAAPTLTLTQPTCTVATGSVTITSVAGETYSFDAGPYNGTLVYSGLAAGSSHTVTSRNASGCISSIANFTLNAQPITPGAPTATPTHPTCTVATGTITITGVAGHTYSFDSGPYNGTLVYSGLAAGSSHTVTTQNAAGCISAITNITLNAQPATPAAPTLAATQPTCTVATGTVTITGVAGLTYSFDSGPYNGTLVYPGLAAGSSHTVTAQNAAGCISAIANITLNAQPASPSTPTLNATQPTCTVATGSVTITAVAGETYSFDSGPYNGTLVYSGLAAGSSHTVTAQNAAGCISPIANITLNAQPVTPAAPTLTPVHPTCTSATGSIIITGVAGLTYSFDSGPYNGTLTYNGLAAGSSHTVTAQNAAGCISAISTITLNAQPATPALPTLSAIQPTCTVATGTINITGIAGLTYSFDSGPFNGTLTYGGIAAGSTHSVRAQNAAGCISGISTITLGPQPPTPATPTLTATHPTCTVATGTVSITGVPGEVYSFDSGAYALTLTYSGLAAGSTHTVTARNLDGCISAIASITLNAQPATPSAPTLAATHPTCTLATGTVTITGVAGLTYSFDSGPYNGTLVYSGLLAGSSHTVTAQNAAGCISPIATITLNAQPATPTAPTLAATQPTCTVATGTVTITGVAGLAYSFDSGPYNGILVYSGLAAGSSHTVTAQNSDGCISPIANITLNAQPVTPAAPTVTPTHPTCTLATGTITITGVAGESYSFDSGPYNSTLVYSGLLAGSSHTVTAQNAAGCISAITNITLNAQPLTPAAPTLTATHPTCTLATGTVTITGIAGLTYSFDSGPYNGTLVYSGLLAGSSHTVTARNAAGCISAIASITLNAQPATPATPTLSATHPTCTVATGSITITGIPGETYSFDSGPYNGTLIYSGLPAGSSHTVTAQNAAGCISVIANITLNAQPTTPAPATLTATHPTCTLATGSVTITGVAGLTYSFDSGPYNGTLVYSGLPAGSSHTVTAQNAAGCISAIANITLNAQPATPATPTIAATHPTCTVATGSVTITGIAGLTYSFDSGPYNGTLVYSGLSAGSSHTVTAQNASGCISAIANITLNAQPATPSAPTLAATHPTCTVATGSITITGVPGETYSFDSGPYNSTLVYSGLAAGSSHTVTAQNGAGCISAISNITLNAQPATPAAPSLAATQPTCTVATGSITITGVVGETYSLDSGPYLPTLVYNGLAVGSHTVTAQNVAGCISAISSITLNAQPGSPSTPTLSATHPTCTVATGSVTITGIAGETYSFDSGPYNGTLVYSGLAAGSSHTVTAQNATGCISPVANITLNAQPVTPAAPTLSATHPTCTSATGSVTITGVAGLTYSFDSGPYNGTLVYSGLAAGSSHTVTAQNASGCTSAIANITLNAQPLTPAAPILAATHPTCTVATGSITITGIPGETYSFDSGPYNGTLIYSGLSAGSSHTVTAQNAAGCISAITNITLNAQPATPSAPTLSAIHPTCTVATGSVTITAVAGETYSFDSGPFNLTLVYSGLAAGSTHNVRAQNAAGCISAVANITLNAQPVTPAAPTLAATHPTCTVATGSVTITGVAGLTYSFDSGPYNGTLVYSGLAAGSSHTVTAQNAAGCISAIANITLNAQPVTPSAPTLAATHPTCTVATGSITITGVAGLTYSLDSGAYLANLVYNGLAVGSHTVTAQNAAGCISAVASITINAQPVTPAAPTLTATHPTCTNATGSVTITGVAGLTYSLDSGAYLPTLTYSGLATGLHTVTAQNAAGCISAVSNITLNAQPGAPSIPTVTLTQPTCTVATGSITITGVAGETYSFDSGPYNSTLIYNGLAAGSSHTITAQNIAGCISPIRAITLNAQPVTPAAPTITPTHPTCTVATGSVTITGIAGLTYSFDSGPYGSILTFNGLAASSTHTVTAQNAAGCISAISTITLNAQPATPTAPTLTAIHPTCNVATGSVVISGVSGETYSFDSGPYNSTLTYSGLAAGSVHTVTAKNAAGCISSPSNITINLQPLTPVVTATPSVATVCTGNNATIQLSTTIVGVSFNWTAVATNVTGASDGNGSLIDQTLTLTGDTPGNVIYTITPSTSECTGNTITVVVTVYPLPVPVLEDGKICVDNVGTTLKNYLFNSHLSGATHTFEWYYEGNLIGGAFQSTYEATQAGNYTVIATNTTTGCKSNPVSAVVTTTTAGESIAVDVTNAFSDDPTVSVTVKPANPDYQYQLDNGQFQDSNVFEDVGPGDHTITVIDVNGCTYLTTEFTIIDYPKFFTPNGDGYNDLWNIIGLDRTAIIYIFDRHGKLLKQISPVGEGWDGNYNGEQQPGTDYWFRAEYTEKMQRKEFKGHFSLKR
jgi:gliding motility-associated-like protein